jgi:hypothetical protein
MESVAREWKKHPMEGKCESRGWKSISRSLEWKAFLKEENFLKDVAQGWKV